MANLTINQLLTPYNYNSSTTSRIQYIVIHYCGALGDAKANCQYYASGYIAASAHYFVGYNGDIWQSVRDKDIAWSVGASSYVHKYCRNSNSLNIEMCVRKKSTSTMNATDKDWYYEDATVKTTIELTKYLMKKYNIPADHVIRHYDVTGKICPNPYVYNNTKYTWSDFKKAIQGKSDTTASTPQPTFNKTGDATCTGQDVRLREVANGPIIEYLDKDQALEVDGKVDGSWTHVRVPKTGSVGYVSSQYVKVKSVDTGTPKPAGTASVTYRVGTAWKNGKCENQHNAFGKLDNAKADADEAMKQLKKTYYVFDESGKVQYTAEYKSSTQVADDKPYRVGTSWKNGKCENQHNSFDILDNAKKDADNAMREFNKTYYVFDKNGQVEYTAKYEAASTTNFSSLVRDAQIHINNFSGSGLKLTGVLDEDTKKGLIRSLKIALNADFRAGLIVNGTAGTKVKTAIGSHYVTANNQKSYLATFVQIALMAHGYEHDGVVCPGPISIAQMNCITKYQKDHGLKADGMAGKDTIWSMSS